MRYVTMEMKMNDVIARINVLAKKAKEGPLNAEELAEFILQND